MHRVVIYVIDSDLYDIPSYKTFCIIVLSFLLAKYLFSH